MHTPATGINYSSNIDCVVRRHSSSWVLSQALAEESELKMAKVTQVRKGGSRECCVSCFMSYRVVSLFSYTRLLARQTRPIFNSVIVKEVCMRVARSTLRRGACNEKEPRTKRYNVRRRSLFKDRKGGGEDGLSVPVYQSWFILAPKRTGADRRGRPSVAASRSGKAETLILENPLPIRITKV